MTEVEREIKKFRIDMQCECGGNFISTGTAQQVGEDPVTYAHFCAVCTTWRMFERSYPRFEDR